MIPANFDERVTYAKLLWQSRMRRWHFTFTALAVNHQLRKFATMSDDKTPGKETIVTKALAEYVATTEDNGKPPAFTFDNLSPQDKALILQIAQRGVEMARQLNVEVDITLAAMDIAVVHTTTCPLHLWRFLASDADDFSHDFTGIGRYIDRKTGFLFGGFKPRFAVKKS